MSFFEHQAWTVSTLAPVHLGTGQDYEFTSYLIDDGVMYTFGDSALFNALPANQLALIADYANNGIAGLKSIQQLLQNNKEALKLCANKLIAIGNGVDNFYQKRKGGNASNYNQMLLPKTACEPYSGIPILPGTALKGAIRTAWLDWKIHQSSRTAPRHTDRPLDILKQITGFKGVNDDPFKTLRVADAKACHVDVLKKIVIFSSLDWKDSKKSKNNERSGLLETVAAGQVDAFELDWRLWSGMDKEPPVKDFKALTKIVNDFYLPIFQQELTRNSDAGYYNTEYQAALHNLFADDELQGQLAAGKAMLLRLGRYTGAVSKTLNDHRKIKIKGQKGAKDKYQPLPNEQRLVVSGEHNVHGSQPFGWVLLTEKGTTPAAVTTFARAIFQQDEQLQKLADVAANQAAKRQQFEQEQTEKLARELAYAAEAAAKEQKLATMSANEQLMFQLDERIERNEGAGSGPSHQMWAELRGMILDNDTWPNVERKQLLPLAKRLANHLNIDLKKNKKAKALIQQIKAES